MGDYYNSYVGADIGGGNCGRGECRRGVGGELLKGGNPKIYFIEAPQNIFGK